MTTHPRLPTVTLPGGEAVRALGQGTWMMATRRQNRADEIAALRRGVDLGMTVIDTAEMYGDGAAEELVAEALGSRRRDIFLVSKVMPQHASRRGTVSACDASLQRLKTDHIDLYLLHWRGRIPLADTLASFDDLLRAGKIRYWGVSNFDVKDMEELVRLSGGLLSPVACNQVLYNVTRRGIEHDLLPWCDRHKVPVMAYSPLEQAKLARHEALRDVAKRLGATTAQVALAWVLRVRQMIAIPKSGRVNGVQENRQALDIQLGPEDLEAIDEAFPPPRRKVRLEMI